jgi:hypothetical protein
VLDQGRTAIIKDTTGAQCGLWQAYGADLVAEDASAEQKAADTQACRTILTALEAEPGKLLALRIGPAPQPLAGIDPERDTGVEPATFSLGI